VLFVEEDRKAAIPAKRVIVYAKNHCEGCGFYIRTTADTGYCPVAGCFKNRKFKNKNLRNLMGSNI